MPNSATLQSKTQQAIALVDQGHSVSAAARQVGTAPGNIWVALKRRRERANAPPATPATPATPADFAQALLTLLPAQLRQQLLAKSREEGVPASLIVESAIRDCVDPDVLVVYLTAEQRSHLRALTSTSNAGTPDHIRLQHFLTPL